MRFIIEYGYGDESCCGTHTTAFDYSSKEQLLLEIERMANEYITNCEYIRSEESQAISNNLRDQFFIQKTITLDEYIAARKKYETPNPVFKYNDYQLTIEHFVEYNHGPNSPQKYIYTPPSVYTVDEWFLYQQEKVYHG